MSNLNRLAGAVGEPERFPPEHILKRSNSKMKRIFATMLLALCLLSKSGSAQNVTLPDAPLPQKETPKVSLITFRRSWENPLLSTNTRTVKSKLFLIPTVALWGSMTFACVNAKRTGEEWHSEVPAVAAVTGLSFLSYRAFSPMFSVGISGYGTAHYLLSFRK